MEKQKVGLIILPHDNSDYFSRAAESVLVNTEYENFELVAVHNPCEDEKVNSEILKIMKTFNMSYSNFSYVINEKNLYHAKGSMEGFYFLMNLNPGIKYIGLLNDDIFIPGGQVSWLRTLVEFMENNENAATVTPSLYHSKETIYWCGKSKEEGTHDFLHLPKGDTRIPTRPIKTIYNNMAICLVRSFLLKEIPLGQSCPQYGSDSEFANRLKDLRPEMEHWVIPSVKLYHDNIYFKRLNRGKDKTVEG